jgi:hypothetical protein
MPGGEIMVQYGGCARMKKDDGFRVGRVQGKLKDARKGCVRIIKSELRAVTRLVMRVGIGPVTQISYNEASPQNLGDTIMHPNRVR